jgi:hypothetical protein
VQHVRAQLAEIFLDAGRCRASRTGRSGFAALAALGYARRDVSEFLSDANKFHVERIEFLPNICRRSGRTLRTRFAALAGCTALWRTSHELVEFQL